jgi:hypothetical protein
MKGRADGPINTGETTLAMPPNRPPTNAAPKASPKDLPLAASAAIVDAKLRAKPTRNFEARPTGVADRMRAALTPTVMAKN